MKHPVIQPITEELVTGINLRLTNATGTASFSMQVDKNTVIADLLSSLRQRLASTSPHNRLGGPNLFYDTSPEIFLYDARLGIFDPAKTLGESGVVPSGVVRWHCHQSSVPLVVSKVSLPSGGKLHEDAILVIAEWRGRTYPIILPAEVTPQGNVEGSLLNQVIFRQIADVEGRDVIAQEGEREWHYHNARTQQVVDPYDMTRPLSQYFKYGDLVKLAPIGTLAPSDDLANEISIIGEDEAPLEDQVTIQSFEQDFLDQIGLGEDEAVVLIDESQQRTKITVNQASLELILGDITQQPTVAIVNAANEALKGGGGVDGAIHQVAGPRLIRASRLLAPCHPGDAVLTPGFNLPARWVIHTVGPIYKDGLRGEPKILSNAYLHSLQLAHNSGFTSIAFPSISTGVYGYPIAKAAKVALETVLEFLNLPQQKLELVRFVLFNDSDYENYCQVLAQLQSP